MTERSRAGTGRLIVVGGPPASGKTTLSLRLARGHDAVRLSPDEWLTEIGSDLRDSWTRDRVEALQWRLARSLLARSLCVVLDWGVFTATKREVLRLGARELGAAVELHFLTAPREVLWQRLVARDAAGERPAPSPAEFAAMLDDVQPPGLDELARFDAPA